MKKKLNFLDLPHEIQIDIIQHLYSYSECHVEHSHGKMEVCTSYCLMSKYPEDHWISQEFTKDDLHMYVRVDWETEWQNMTRGWEYMTNDEKDLLIKAQHVILRARAEQDLKHIKYMEAR